MNVKYQIFRSSLTYWSNKENLVIWNNICYYSQDENKDNGKPKDNKEEGKDPSENDPQEDKENFEINTSTLKAIKLSPEEVNALRQAASWGVNNKDTAEKALKSKRTSYNADQKRKEAAATIEIFNRITA